MIKKTITGFVISIILSLGFSMVAMAACDDYVKELEVLEKGDLNSDDKYSFRDALMILLDIAKLEELTEENTDKADVNADGIVDIKDAEMLFDAALGKYRNFGYEKPEGNCIIVDSYSLDKGDYCYRNLADAVKYVNSHAPKSEEERLTVYLAPGDHRASTKLTAPFVTYRAADPLNEEKANVTFYYGCGYAYYSLNNGETKATGNNATLYLDKSAHDFRAEYIRIENSFNLYITEEERTDYCPYPNNLVLLYQRENDLSNGRFQTQAQAITAYADRISFYNCEIVSRQDTLYINGGRCYFENCFIEGTDDFIYGTAAAVFESCQINTPYGQGCITAANTYEDVKFGYLFKDCKITNEKTCEFGPATIGSTSLGRPWNGPAMVMFWNCKMSEHVRTGDERFMSFASANKWFKENARFAEGNTTDMEGNPINYAEVCPSYEKIVEASEVAVDGEYAFYKWLLGSDNWNPGNYETAK